THRPRLHRRVRAQLARQLRPGAVLPRRGRQLPDGGAHHRPGDGQGGDTGGPRRHENQGRRPEARHAGRGLRRRRGVHRAHGLLPAQGPLGADPPGGGVQNQRRRQDQRLEGIPGPLPQHAPARPFPRGHGTHPGLLRESANAPNNHNRHNNNEAHTMKHSLSPLKSSALAAALMPLAMAPALAAEGQPAARQIEEILVSARRTQEDSQTVPVTMHAFSDDSMREKSFILLKDLMYTVPGLFMAGGGPQENAIYSIRGQGRPVAGAGQPGVLTYFADVPMPTFASSVPAYDIASVQVLKGPQGTLFGRNTTGGAILTYPNQPTYEFGGYLDTNFGNYDLNTYEGVVNIPLVDQKLALRISGYLDRRDGLIENVGNGPDLDDLHSDNLRISLLWEPWDNVKNNLVYEYRKQRQSGSAPRIVETTDALDIYGPDIAAIARFGADRQAALGPWKVDYGDYQPFSDVDASAVYNRTDIDFGAVTLTNIFGYREQEWDTNIRTDGFPGYISQFGNTVGFITS